MRATYHRPLIPLTLALMGGIAVGAEVPGLDPFVFPAAAVFALALGCSLVRRVPDPLSPLLLFAALGYLSLQPWIHPRFSEDHLIRFVDTGPWRIVGVVDARPLGFESRTKFALRTERIDGDSEHHAAAGLLRVTLGGSCPRRWSRGTASRSAAASAP